MKSVKLALLAAAAVLVVAPATAQPDRPDRGERHGGRPGGFGDGDRGNMRPTPPQANVQPAPRPQPQAAPQPQQSPRGNWGGGRRFDAPQGNQNNMRAQWWANRGQPDRGNMRPTPPQANGQVPPQNGGQWNRGDWQQRRDRDPNFRAPDGGPRDDRRWDRDGRRDGGDRRWDNDGRNGDRRWNGNDRRWDDNDRRWNGNDRRWQDGRRGDDRRWGGRGHGPRPDLNWRNDRRYDWRGWRNTHRDIFRRGHYHAPYGYGYRSVYRGFFLEPLFYSSTYWLADPYEYRLPPVEWPYRWVRYYDDALLVDTTSGEVVDVIEGFFF